MARLLVVDDNALVRQLLIDILRGAGHEVRAAANGCQALAAAKVDPPDVIITDFYMPEMDGAEFIRAVRRGEAGSRTVPIIALAGSHQAEEKTVEAGASTYLSKPLQEDVILEAVRLALSET